MRILVFGAGNVGTLYAGLLAEAGQDVSILARGSRLERLRSEGIELAAFGTGRTTMVRPPVVEELRPDDAYDLIIVALGRSQVEDALPALARNRATPSVLFFGNDAAGPRRLVEVLGADRVLLGFPGAAAMRQDGRLTYLILSKADQPTTLGEIDGRSSNRLDAIAAALESAGFNVALCPKMDAWLKTHAVEILPTACALYMTGGDPQRLAQRPEVLDLMLRGIREGYAVLEGNGVPIVPSRHLIFRWLPSRLLIGLAKRMLQTDEAGIKIGHAMHARPEMALLAKDVKQLAEAASVPTPWLDRLTSWIDPSADRNAA